MDEISDPAFIRRMLKLRGLSKSGLAQTLKVPNSAITELLKGNRRLLAAEVPKLKAYLKLDTVPLKGYVSAGRREYSELPDDELDRVPAPEYNTTDKTAAMELRGQSLGPIFETWLAYFDRIEIDPESLAGQLCVVRIETGEVVIKKIEKGSRKDRYVLISNTEADIRDVKIEWAYRVKLIRPRY